MTPAEGLVYDRNGCFLVTAEDFRVTPSRDDTSAYRRDSVALGIFRTVHRAVPVPAASIRRLTITP
jgi:hypothetical protein